MESVGTHMAVGLTESGDIDTPSQISHIQVLPNELLSAIFRAGSLMPSKRFGIQFPELVCMVNKHWRSVAVSTPDIWCSILIYWSRPIDSTSRWFERSKSCLLCITFDGPITRAAIELVRLHLDRWRQLVIKATVQDEVEDFFVSFGDTYAPRLEAVDIRVFNDTDTNRVDSNFITPSLRSLRLRTVCLCLRPPLVGLTHMQLHGIGFTDSAFRDIIAAAPSLSHLIVTAIYRLESIEQNSQELPMVVAPSLRCLAIRRSILFSGASPCGCLLCVFSTPNLECLEISDSVGAPRHFQAHPNMYSNVRTLCLQDISMAPSFLDIFQALPTVTHLQLIPGDLDFLTSHPDWHTGGRDAGSDSNPADRLLWPKLRVITFDTVDPEEVTFLREVISNRIMQGVPLDKVRLSRAAWAGSAETRTWIQERVQVEVIDDDEMGESDDWKSDSDSDDLWEYSDDEVDDSPEYFETYDDFEDWGLEGVESYET